MLREEVATGLGDWIEFMPAGTNIGVLCGAVAKFILAEKAIRHRRPTLRARNMGHQSPRSQAAMSPVSATGVCAKVCGPTGTKKPC